MGVFPSPSRPSVIWIGVVDGGQTARVYADLSGRFSRLGLRTESRAFHPHITVARVKGRIERGALDGLLRKWNEHSFGKQRVCELILKKSELTPAGALHTSLHVSALRH